MKFGPVSLSQACGAILAHSVVLPTGRLRKGLCLTEAHLTAMGDAGMEQVIVARTEPGDVLEDAAALRVAQALVSDAGAVNLRMTKAFTGRVNLIADTPGVVEIDPNAIDAVNRIDPMLTIATVPAHQQMAPGGMVATIKIIAYAVPEAAVSRAEAILKDAMALRLRAPRLRTARLIVTLIPGGAGEKGVEAIENRVKALNMSLTQVDTVPHRLEDIQAALAQDHDVDLTLILTGSATSDPYDIAPLALRLSGGEVERFGMPVDPGNLLFIGGLQGRPVIGLPGCARSPALNGADWVLSRVACGVQVTHDDIAGMGVGGLLKEIPTRPQPRAGRG